MPLATVSQVAATLPIATLGSDTIKPASDHQNLPPAQRMNGMWLSPRPAPTTSACHASVGFGNLRVARRNSR